MNIKFDIVIMKFKCTELVNFIIANTTITKLIQ